MSIVISGIQQIGIGVPDAEEAFTWYRKAFGMDVPIFKDAATATLMTRYTSGIAEQRYAILAMNMQGGGGFEIWQYTSKVPVKPSFEPSLGDTGFFCVKMKARNVEKQYAHLKSLGARLLGEPALSPEGKLHFFVVDPYDNLFEVIEGRSWFKNAAWNTGGVGGVVIGVSNMEKALRLYKDILGYKHLVYDKTGAFDDIKMLPGGTRLCRRVLLTSPANMPGAFGRLLGTTEIELVEVRDYKPRKIFENRNWGDRGFIHLCFDIRGMKALAQECAAQGFPFTVDSANSFDMGKAAGHFTYIEDPDGTWIEFVETHKIPILEKLGWYLSLKNRDPEKPLPNWMLNALSLNRVKD
jgi:catechol 2,3-dioxygenase-like lactoylglutathione lyase family enzyme